MQKTCFARLFIILSVFLMGGTIKSLAVQNQIVQVVSTSEPISFWSMCDKTGSFRLEFGPGSKLSAGDQITIDLSYISPADHTKLCKDIDIELSLGGDAENILASRFMEVSMPTDTDSAVYVDGPNGASASAGNGIYFRIHGNYGTQRITLDILGDTGAHLQVGNDPSDKLVVNFFDQRTVNVYTSDYFTSQYTWPAGKGDNSLCIDVSEWSDATVQGNMDSLNDKYTFIPSNPQIAHIIDPVPISFAYCGYPPNPGQIARGIVGETNGEDWSTCTSFDYETGYGYAPSNRYGTNRLILQSAVPFIPTTYQVELEIVVDGQKGDHGVYFTNDLLEVGGFDTIEDSCAATVTAYDDSLTNVGVQMYYSGTGSPLNYTNLFVQPSPDSCSVPTTARAVKLRSAETSLGLSINNDFIVIDIPALMYDRNMLVGGEFVSIRVGLIKLPCAMIFYGENNIGTMFLDPTDVDDDTDGYTENQGDCNDSDDAIHPGASEFCGDGIDQDCDGGDEACPNIDSDNDGILDHIEDANQNGQADAGETDPTNRDTDNDGIQDGTELGYTLDDIGPDTDTSVFIPDADPATTTDPLDADSDNDGMSDGQEDLNHNGAVDNGETDPMLRDKSGAMSWLPLLLE